MRAWGRAPSPALRPARPGGTVRRRRGPGLGRVLVEIGRAAGLHSVGITTTEVFEETRRHLFQRRATGPARRDAVHLPESRPLDRSVPNPPRGPVPGRRGLELPSARSRPEPVDQPVRTPPSTRSRDGWPATPVPTTTGRSARALGPVADHLRSLGLAGLGGLATTTPWSTGPPPTGPASAGSGRTPSSSSRVRARGSSWARWSPTPPSDPTGPSRRPRRGVRELHPVHDRLPDRRPGCAGSASTPAGAWPGWSRPRAPSPRSTARRWVTASTAATSASRSVPSTGSPTAGTHLRRSPTRTPAAVDLLDLLGATDEQLLACARPLVHRRPGSPLPSPQRPGGPGQQRRRDPCRHRVGPPPLAGGRATPSSPSTPAGLPVGWAGTTWWRPPRDPPAGHQRLPAQGRAASRPTCGSSGRRMDPDSFVVLTARSHPDADAFDRAQAERGIRIERTAEPRAGPDPAPGPADP